MPFPHTDYAVTEEMIKMVAPTGSGVYGISNAEKWIYVGETNGIERRLLEHLKETNTCIMRANPTLFTWEECAARDRISRQDQLILELKPLCNQKLG